MYEGTIVQGKCARCGPIDLRPTEIACALPPSTDGRGLAEFRCPICSGWVFNPLTISEARLLILFGAADVTGAAPLELTEERREPVLSPDDLIDFHTAIERIPFPQTELCGECA